MLHMVRKVLGTAAVLLAILFISSCNGGSPEPPQSTLTIAPPQNPYQSITRTPVPPTSTVSIPTEQPLLPTPTPFKHSVQPGDTLYGIALQYNISLDRLVSANPGIDTSLLSVGTELVIPFSDEDDLSVPTPTPFMIPISNPYCYPSRNDGAWCMVIAENDQAIPLENISVVINIYNSNKELINNYVAITPLNNLLPGQSLPLTAYIDDNLPDSYHSNAVLLTSLPSEDFEPRTEITQKFYQYREERTIAHITGSVMATGDNLKDTQVWIAAVAYSEGSPVGVRKWISSQDLDQEKEITFDLVLYSLGPTIDEIKLFSELY